jgi:HAMP domain-containing protein
MNRESISFKLKVFLVSTIILVCLAIIYSYFMFYNKNTFYPTVNKGRLLTNSTKVKLEEDLSNNSTSLQEKSNFNYTVVDIKGRVLFSSISDYKINTVVSLQDFMEYDSKSSLEHPAFVRYTQPFIINNTEVGSVAFLIPKKDFLDQSPDFLTLLDVIPISIALIIIIILIISVYIFAQKNILRPIATLNESASKILKGDFSYKIKYDYDTEIGAFCHNFEAMRDELKFSKEKEVAIKNGDKKRISQVMYNLISNSIKYSKENGTISIYFENTANYMKIYIKDNGIGISSADMPYIFKKFYRGEKSRNQNISGSGLGLSISKYIVEAHGGFINCVQSSSEGTTICFSLPI